MLLTLPSAAWNAPTSAPQLCHSFKLPPLSPSHPLLCSSGAAWSILEHSLPSVPPNWAQRPPLRAASGLKSPPNVTIMRVARSQQDIYRSHFPGKGMWTWETPGCCWGEEGLG